MSGVRYMSAYNSSASLALWDSEGHVRTVMRRRVLNDYALGSLALLGRVTAELNKRRIDVRRIDPAACVLCRADPLP